MPEIPLTRNPDIYDNRLRLDANTFRVTGTHSNLVQVAGRETS